MESRLYVLIYAILCRRFEHPWILVSSGGLGTSTPWIPRDNFHSGESRVICRVIYRGSVPLIPVLFKGKLYMFLHRNGKMHKIV